MTPPRWQTQNVPPTTYQGCPCPFYRRALAKWRRVGNLVDDPPIVGATYVGRESGDSAAVRKYCVNRSSGDAADVDAFSRRFLYAARLSRC